MVILQTFLSTFLVIHGENLFQTVKSLLRRGGEGTGVIRKCKTIEKIHPKLQNQKKFDQKPKTLCKTIKTDKFSHPSCQNPNRSTTVVTSGAYRSFATIPDQ